MRGRGARRRLSPGGSLGAIAYITEVSSHDGDQDVLRRPDEVVVRLASSVLRFDL